MTSTAAGLVSYRPIPGILRESTNPSTPPIKRLLYLDLSRACMQVPYESWDLVLSESMTMSRLVHNGAAGAVYRISSGTGRHREAYE
jgi:hypothetical protein